MAHPPDLTAEADLADDDGPLVRRGVDLRPLHRHGRRQVHSRLGEPDAADAVEVDVALAERKARPLLQDGDEELQAGEVETPCGTPRHGLGRGDGERLNLDDEGPRPLGGDGEHVPRDGQAALVEEGPAGAADLLHPGRHELEDAQLPGRPEAVLQPPEKAVLAMAVPLQVEDDVDHVLQGAGPGDGPLLGDVPNQQNGNPTALGALEQPGDRRPHLGGAAGVAGGVGIVQRLHRVHDRQRRVGRLDHGDAAGQRGLVRDDHPLVEAPHPLRPHRQLGRRFLASAVEAGRLRRADAVGELEGEGRLADARVAAEQDQGALHQPAAEDSVHFGEAGWQPLRAPPADAPEPDRHGGGISRPAPGRPGPRLGQRVPLQAGVAAALPLRTGGAARPADEDRAARIASQSSHGQPS